MTLRKHGEHQRRRADVAAVGPEPALDALTAKLPGPVRRAMAAIPDPGSVECVQFTTRLLLAIALVEGQRVKAGEGRWDDFVALVRGVGPHIIRGIRAQRDVFGEAATLGDIVVTRDDRVLLWETDADGKPQPRELSPVEIAAYRERIFRAPPLPPGAPKTETK